jgi:hypothetical protein
MMKVGTRWGEMMWRQHQLAKLKWTEISIRDGISDDVLYLVSRQTCVMTKYYLPTFFMHDTILTPLVLCLHAFNKLLGCHLLEQHSDFDSCKDSHVLASPPHGALKAVLVALV